jgi:DNA replication and repair protein RecF
MYLAQLDLRDFRNYERLGLELSAGVVILHGPNGAGKTNLLESIAVAATGDSPRARVTQEMVRCGSEVGFVRADFGGQDDRTRIEIGLAAAGHRRVRIDGVVRRRADLIGLAPVVLFWVEDIEMVRGEPSGRRRLLDRELGAIRRPYDYHHGRYRRALEQRNKLLKLIRERREKAEALAPWEAALARHGARVMAERARFVAALAPEAGQAHAALTGGTRHLGMEYRPSIGMPEAQIAARGGKDADARVEEIAQAVSATLAGERGNDILYGRTQSGPHRDDVELTLDGQPVRAFASQGEQRSCAVAIRMGLAKVVENITGKAPLLLLDDVLSELDEGRRRGVFAGCRSEQAIVTCCDLADIPAEVRARGAVLRIEGGGVL